MQTLQDLIRAFRVYAVCEPCERMIAVDLPLLMSRHGPDMTLDQLRNRVRCAACGVRTQDIRIVYVGPCGSAGRFHYQR